MVTSTPVVTMSTRELDAELCTIWFNSPELNREDIVRLWERYRLTWGEWPVCGVASTSRRPVTSIGGR